MTDERGSGVGDGGVTLTVWFEAGGADWGRKGALPASCRGSPGAWSYVDEAASQFTRISPSAGCRQHSALYLEIGCYFHAMFYMWNTLVLRAVSGSGRSWQLP